MRNPHAGQPFTASDEQISAALADVSVPALLMACVHMTDDEAVRRRILDGPLKPAGIRGSAFDTARWDHDVELAGKSVVMIGAGATGFQVAPAIADTVGQLTIFQRTAQWMFPNPNYHAAVGDGTRWALKHLPFYGRWFRFLVFWPGCDTGLAAARVDPDWPDQQRAVSAARTSPAGAGPTCRRPGAPGRRPTWASPSPASRTSSACTARAPTWQAAEA